MQCPGHSPSGQWSIIGTHISGSGHPRNQNFDSPSLQTLLPILFSHHSGLFLQGTSFHLARKWLDKELDNLRHCTSTEPLMAYRSQDVDNLEVIVRNLVLKYFKLPPITIPIFSPWASHVFRSTTCITMCWTVSIHCLHAIFRGRTA